MSSKRKPSVGAENMGRRSGDGAGPPPGKKRRTPSQEEDDDPMNASQRPDFTYQPTMASEAESGIIERVYLKNFMCHARLEFKFCPNVNFVVGRNGSGKSAVLTAIVIGLGGKATVTNRGTAIKSLIKSGRQSAEISIKLRNRGEDAYKPEQYGDAIIIDRRITPESSSYKLKSADGKVVSQKREDLSHILDQFNIQVDNPLAILNQDTSRNFLHSKQSSDKYKFFLKATQLEQMKHDYVVANDSKEVAQSILQRKQQTLPELKREVLECEQRYKALATLEELKTKVNRLKDEMAWAFVYAKEKEVESALKEYKQEEARTPKFVQKIEEFNAKVEACVQEQKTIQDQVRNIGVEAKELEPRYQEAKKGRESKKQAVRNAQTDARRAHSEVNSNKKDREQILERIEELRNSAQQDYESERRAREERIQELQEDVDSHEAMKKTTEHELSQFSNAVTRAKENQYRLRTEEHDLRSKVEQTRRNITTLKSARNDRLKRFGHWTTAVQKKIQDYCKKGMFHKQPRGPFGAGISLRDNKWALAVEYCLKALIHAYACHDHHDEKVLEKIFSEECPEGRKPSTIVSKFQANVYDVSNHRAQTNKYPTVLDVLEIQDPVIANCLIDQRQIEAILLFEDVKEARKVMGGTPPQNCREGFALKGDQLISVPTFRYYSCPSDFKARFLAANLEEDIRNMEQEFMVLQQEMRNVSEKANQVNREIQTNQQQERSCQTRLNKINNALGKINFEIRELKSREDPAPVDLTTLEEEVQKYNDLLAGLEEKMQAVDQAFTNAKAELEQAEHHFRDIDARMRVVAESADPFKEKLAHVENSIEQYKSTRKHYEGKMKEHQKKIADCQKVYEQKKKEFEEDTAKAQQMCEQVKTRRSPQNLESEIQHINKRIKAEEKSRGNHEEITLKYNEVYESYKKISAEVKQLQNFLKLLDEVMAERQEQYFNLRQMIAMRAKYFFIVMLNNRQYTGKMNFNHQRETLELTVHPSKNTDTQTKDIRALSGGERSFATVCFILALWDAMESPFRCLDEFDVFMDMVNRRISMDMMMDVAKHQKGRQFIFLTPLDMSIIKMSNNVRIYRMPDPDRGAGVIMTREDQNQEEDQMQT